MSNYWALFFGPGGSGQDAESTLDFHRASFDPVLLLLSRLPVDLPSASHSPGFLWLISPAEKCCLNVVEAVVGIA